MGEVVTGAVMGQAVQENQLDHCTYTHKRRGQVYREFGALAVVVLSYGHRLNLDLYLTFTFYKSKSVEYGTSACVSTLVLASDL